HGPVDRVGELAVVGPARVLAAQQAGEGAAAPAPAGFRSGHGVRPVDGMGAPFRLVAGAAPSVVGEVVEFRAGPAPLALTPGWVRPTRRSGPGTGTGR